MVINSTSLISIDLVVYNEKDEVFLGKRLNVPAKGFLFVSDGCIQKNETPDSTFSSLLSEALGINPGINCKNVKFLGIYGHYFDKSISNYCYMILKYKVKLNQGWQVYFLLIRHEIYIFLRRCMVVVKNILKNYLIKMSPLL